MYRFTPEGLTVTDRLVAVHGCWDLGHAKRFDTIRVPLDLFLAESVLQALNEAHSRRPKYPADEWEQFLLWG